MRATEAVTALTAGAGAQMVSPAEIAQSVTEATALTVMVPDTNNIMYSDQ